MIFISGIHGAGKSYFCNILKDRFGIVSYSASALISERKKIGFSSNKLVSNIDENQLCLLDAVNELKAMDKKFLLDGHLCLLNQSGAITRISLDTITALQPDAIVLLTEDPEIIAKRRQERDGVEHSAESIKAFQNEEIQYATEVARLLHVPLKITTGSSDIDDTIEFINNRGN